MVEDKPQKVKDKPQKVKLVGALFTARQIVGLIKDITLLIFLLVLIFGVIFFVTFASQIQLPF
ncbi:MAG: hypothetical protein WCV90_02150 [Candidatus Woesearchaeota archaeon]|jgi:hypothetical protein